MKFSHRIIFYLSLLCYIASIAFGDALIKEFQNDDNILENTFIIQYEPTLAPNIILDRIRGVGINYTHRYNLESIDSVSLKFYEKDGIHRCSQIPGIERIWPVRKLKPRLFTADKITGFNVFRQQTGFDGSGIKVGMIDNGLDYMHPAFGQCFKTPGCKTQFGFDFIGEGSFDNPIPDADPLELCEGHGTHVAGIVAAVDHELGFTGVAPGVTLGIYRAIDCSSTTTDDLIIQAMQMAQNDGMDIMNLSLGTDFRSWSDSPVGIAVTKATEKGFVVVVSSANLGTLGLFTAGSPDSTNSAITVGHVDNLQYISFVLTPSNDNKKKIPYVTTRITVRFSLHGPLPIAIANTTTNLPEFDGCNPYTIDLTGKIALIRRGQCDFSKKNENAMAAGAVATIFYNNDASLVPVLSLDIVFPSAFISDVDGEYLKKQIRKNKDLTVTFPDKTIAIPLENARKPSNESSLGPTFELNIKPEVLAPGGRIFSTFPRNLGSYATISGTSMAAAYVSGSIALYMQATGLKRGKFDPIQLRDVLTYTAKPIFLPDSRERHTRIPYSPNKQGGGLIDIVSALRTKTHIQPSKLLLNDTAHFNGTQQIILKNVGHKTAKYTLSHIPSESLRGWFNDVWVGTESIVVEKRFAKVKFSKNHVKVHPGRTVKITVKFTPPKNMPNDFGVYAGYIGIKDSVQRQSFSIPYLGVKGDLYNIPILSSIQPPHIEREETQEVFDKPDQVVRFTFLNGNGRQDFPTFFYVLNYGSRLVKIELFKRGEINPGGFVGLPVFDKDTNPEGQAGRNGGFGNRASSLKFWGSGRVVNGQNVFIVPNGQYQAVLSILRPFGNPSNNKDFVTWDQFPIIEVARP